MRYGGANKRRDSNEGEIRKALHAIGAQTWQINGRKLPDLIVLFRGRWFPLGVKTQTGSLRPGEADAPWPLVRSVEQALAAVGVR